MTIKISFIILFYILFATVAHAEESQDLQEQAADHWLYTVVPESKKSIKWYDLPHWITWAMFGNDDDGIFGEKPTARYNTRLPICTRRAAAWTLRNPLHNFNFYVIGSAYRENSEFTIVQLAKEKISFFEYKKKATTNFAGKGTSFYFGFHGWKPFISLRIDYGRLFDFYLGWRERGNFGIKFIPAKKKKYG